MISRENKKEMRQDYTRVESEIRQVLLKEWDPIGVFDMPEVHDEYDHYIPDVHRLLLNGAQDKEIAEYLGNVCIDRMGIAANAHGIETTICALRMIQLN